MRQKIILLALMLLLPFTSFAWGDMWEGGYDFEVDSIYYRIISSNAVKVCTKSWCADAGEAIHSLEISYSGSISIPENVTFEETSYTVIGIDDVAFSHCRDVTSVTIPKSVKTIGLRAFDKCSGLESIQVNIDNPVFDSRDNCNAIIETATNTLITGCNNTIIPNSITTIGREAFCGRTGLTSIEIPNSVTKIASGDHGIWLWDNSDHDGVTGAFLECTSLSEIVIPSSVLTIGAGAFFGCTGLTRVEIGESVSSISNTILSDGYIDSPGAFEGCSGITDLVWNAINCNAGNMSIETIERVTIGEQVDRIPSNFVSGSKITSLSIPSSVSFIGNNAFSNCSNLSNINVDSNNTVFDSRDSCNAIINTTTNTLLVGCVNTVIPSTVTAINNNAFYGCSELTNVIIPNSINTIGSSAFSGCSNLVSVTSMAVDPPSINYNSFDCYNTATLYIPRKNYYAYINAYGWREFTNIQGTYDFKSDGIYYDFTSDSTVYMSGVDDNYFSDCGDVIIPESVCYDGKDYIVNAIDEKAFYNCSGLTSVIIPNTITTIGDYAFYGCSGLTSLTIGKSVASIGYDAFNGCNNLKELNWNAINCSSNNNMPKSNIESVTIGLEVEVLPNYFVSGSKITAVEIPNSVKSIGRNAFSDCNGLTSIEIPNSVTSIGICAFYGCSELISVIISNSVTSIGDNVFENCYSLSNIIIPNSVSSIGNYVFRYCNNLKSITIPNSVSSIGKYAFYGCSRMMSLDIPSSVTTIGSFAFYNCDALSKVTISDVAAWCNITFYDSYANPLYYSHHLYMSGQEIKHLIIPEGVTAINNYAFINGTSFIDLTLPYTLESIGISAFEGCKRLTNVSMGLSVTAIGPSAFKDCTAISSVTCMAPTPPAMADVNCFDSDCYDWAILYVPGDKVDEYKSTIYWNKFANTFGTGIEVDGLYYLFDLDNGEATVTYKDETYCSYTGEVTIPETVNYGGLEYTVTGIGKAAFAYCDELTSVAIPNTVTSIGDYAFMYCEGLTSITIPNSVTSIGDNSFDGCGAICAIEIPNSVASIGSMAFQGCTSLTDIMIGSDLASIGAKAFNYCNSLHSVTCMGNVPPLMDNSDCFTSYGYTATLKVPQTSIEDYQSANYWYKFAAIEGFDVSEPGDVNGDGGINISDVTALIDLLLSGGEISAGADVNGDGQVNISDVTALIDRLLSGN